MRISIFGALLAVGHLLAFVFAFFVRSVAEPFHLVGEAWTNIISAPRLGYVGPSINLRHEAGTSRRSAARGI